MKQGLWVIWLMYVVIFAFLIWGIVWLLGRTEKRTGSDDPEMPPRE